MLNRLFDTKYEIRVTRYKRARESQRISLISANCFRANSCNSWIKKDKRHFYIIARGSSFETQSHLIYGKRVQYFSDEQVEVLLPEYNELIFDLNKILKTLDENY